MTRSRGEIRQRGKESGNNREGIRIGIFYLKYIRVGNAGEETRAGIHEKE